MTTRRTWKNRAVATRGLEGHLPSPFFCRSVNQVGHIMPTIFCMPLQIFRHSHGPNLVTYDSLHQFFCTRVSLKSSIQRHMIQNHVIHVVRNSSLHMWIFGYNRHSFLLKNLYKLITMKNEKELCTF